MRTLLALLLLTSTAWAHSWYDGWCCHDRDCKPVAAEEIIHNDDGTMSYRNCRFPKARILPSQDGDYHVCILPNGACQCLYRPLFF